MDSLEERATCTLINTHIFLACEAERKREKCEGGIDEARGVAKPLESALGNAHQMGPEAE